MMNRVWSACSVAESADEDRVSNKECRMVNYLQRFGKVSGVLDVIVYFAVGG